MSALNNPLKYVDPTGKYFYDRLFPTYSPFGHSNPAGFLRGGGAGFRGTRSPMTKMPGMDSGSREEASTGDAGSDSGETAPPPPPPQEQEQSSKAEEKSETANNGASGEADEMGSSKGEKPESALVTEMQVCVDAACPTFEQMTGTTVDLYVAETLSEWHQITGGGKYAGVASAPNNETGGASVIVFPPYAESIGQNMYGYDGDPAGFANFAVAHELVHQAEGLKGSEHFTQKFEALTDKWQIIISSSYP